jgi:hypothetical protein
MLERASTGLINNLLAAQRIEFRNDVVAYFSAYQETA